MKKEGTKLTIELINTCKIKLIETKQDLLNRFRDAQKMMAEISADRGGDEGDQTHRILAEKSALLAQKRLREALLEVESALARIEQGRFGICEETEEFIETERLLAIPWTRLSIEGAETREDAAAIAK
jgi:DnaK suppressor protein